MTFLKLCKWIGNSSMMRLIFLLLIGIISIQAHAQTATTRNDIRPEAPTVSQKDIITINHVNLYPNPVADFLNVKIENSTLEKVEFELYNIIGNNLSVKVEELDESSFKLDIKDLNPGYYLVVIKDPLKRFNKSYKFQKL